MKGFRIVDLKIADCGMISNVLLICTGQLFFREITFEKTEMIGYPEVIPQSEIRNRHGIRLKIQY